MAASKPSLILVDGQKNLRQEISARLAPLYSIRDFGSIPEALRHARLAVPDAMLISSSLAFDLHFAVVQTMRLEPIFEMMPIVILADSGKPEQCEAALHAGATSCLAKPYKLSSLVRTISSALNTTVEKKWDRLPEPQAAALKCSIAVFSSVSDRIAAGKTIPYGEINLACQPLLDAVNANDVKTVLQGVRDHDDYTYSHSLRVAVFLAMFGRSIGLTGENQNVLTIGGLLHDLGKITIPSLVLNKPGRLEDDEFEMMKGHVPATLKLLERCSELPRAAFIIAGQHHERLDGSGYPNGLSGAKLNELARMAAIADVFSALTDRRVYKNEMTPEEAFKIMAEEMRPHLDLRLLERFRQMLLDTKLN